MMTNHLALKRRRPGDAGRRGEVRFLAVAVRTAVVRGRRWSAGRRSAPEAGGSRKGIVLWRAPRPKRERVATFARVARPTTWRLPALHRLARG